MLWTDQGAWRAPRTSTKWSKLRIPMLSTGPKAVAQINDLWVTNSMWSKSPPETVRRRDPTSHLDLLHTVPAWSTRRTIPNGISTHSKAPNMIWNTTLPVLFNLWSTKSCKRWFRSKVTQIRKILFTIRKRWWGTERSKIWVQRIWLRASAFRGKIRIVWLLRVVSETWRKMAVIWISRRNSLR